MENRIRKWIEKYIEEINQNKIYQTFWKKPLVAFLRADDEGFNQLKEKTDNFHLLPVDILVTAESVVVYFLPFDESISKGNFGGELASEEWAQAYVDTNDLIRDLNEKLSEFLSNFKFESKVLPPTHNFDTEKLISWWSHKHIAYLAGMGSFGLHQMLITDSGSAGRFGSIVTSMPISEEKKKSKAGCLWIENGSCGICVKNCTFGALKIDSFDRQLCYEILLKNAEFYEEKGISDACGKCLAKVPCSFQNPLTGLCPICSSVTKKIKDGKKEIYYIKCSRCDFIYKDPKHKISEDAEKSRYEEHNNSIDDPRYVQYFEKFIKTSIFPFAPSGKDLLDFGSGPSPVLGEILKEKYEYNVDIYDYYFKPEKIYIGKKYDVITCTEVIEHIANPMDYFNLFSEILKENGILALMTYFHPKEDEDFFNWHYVRDKTHISFFSQKTIEYISRELNMEMLFTDGVKTAVFKKRDGSKEMY